MDQSKPLVAGIEPAAVYQIADLDALDAVYADPSRGYIYARDAHPNAASLAAAINHLEGADWGIAVGSGMAAIALPMLALCEADSRIVADRQLYGKSIALLLHARRFAIEVEFIDVHDDAALKHALAAPARLLLVETISNPLLHAANLEALAAAAHAAGALLLVDNTLAGPTVRRPLEEGADFVVESLTKMMNGHSDVTLGYLGGRNAAMREPFAAAATMWGLFASPFDCWLAERGLATLPLRMAAAAANARRLAAWLRPRASRLFDPGIANMLAFELPGREAVNTFIRRSGIPFCPSLGHHETTLSHPWSTSHRALSDEEKLARGITPGLVRLSVGCEDYDRLQAAMACGLGRED